MPMLCQHSYKIFAVLRGRPRTSRCHNRLLQAPTCPPGANVQPTVRIQMAKVCTLVGAQWKAQIVLDMRIADRLPTMRSATEQVC
jgi:hypothetical protein